MSQTRNISPTITLHTFHPEDQPAVKDLILAGLVEHWGRLDPTKNPDLEDITTSYADATFLVARRAGQIVGTGALVPRQDGVAEVVRMTVAAEHRRQGIGRFILQELVLRARHAGFQSVILETTQTWQEVIAFYVQCGFHITHYQSGDVYFAMELDVRTPNQPSPSVE